MTTSDKTSTQPRQAAREAEFAKMTKGFERKLNKLRKDITADSLTLAQKLKIKGQIKELEDRLHEHKLNYHPFVLGHQDHTETVPQFETGALFISDGVLALYPTKEAAFAVLTRLCKRHIAGDWGSVTADEAEYNQLAIADEGEITSKYQVTLPDGQNRDLYLTTSAGHSFTRLHLQNGE